MAITARTVLCFLLFVSSSAAQLSEQEIIELHEAGQPASAITATIRAKGLDFELTADTISELQESGLPDDVVEALISEGLIRRLAENDLLEAGDEMPTRDGGLAVFNLHQILAQSQFGTKLVTDVKTGALAESLAGERLHTTLAPAVQQVASRSGARLLLRESGMAVLDRRLDVTSAIISLIDGAAPAELSDPPQEIRVAVMDPDRVRNELGPGNERRFMNELGSVINGIAAKNKIGIILRAKPGFTFVLDPALDITPTMVAVFRGSSSYKTAKIPRFQKAHISVINIDRVTRESERGKALFSELEAMNDRLRAEREKRSKKLESLEGRPEHEKKQAEFYRWLSREQKKFIRKQVKLETDFQKILAPVVERVAGDNDVGLLLRAGKGLVFVRDPKLDITSSVIKELDGT